MREYERFSTACANAYLQPLMGRYVSKLERELARAGFRCPLLLMTSGGGITTTDTAIRFPGAPGRIRPGGRRDLCRLHRAPARARSGAFRSTWAAPPRKSASSTRRSRRPRARSRSRAFIVSQRQRPAAAHPGDRNGRDRRRRRLDRPRRYARTHHMSGRIAPARSRDPSATAAAAKNPP